MQLNKQTDACQSHDWLPDYIPARTDNCNAFKNQKRFLLRHWSNKCDVVISGFFFFLQIVTVISSSEVFLHNGPHGPLLWEPSKFELLPSSVSPQSQNQSACQNNHHSGKKTHKKIILSWSTTWHILKNAVCFEHSKCTHIDRCSRLLSPSPANREAHTRVVIIGLEE